MNCRLAGAHGLKSLSRGQAVLGRQIPTTTPWLTERHGDASPTYPIRESGYHEGWANSVTFKNVKEFYVIRLWLGADFGGPLFFTHYSYLGLRPRGLKGRHAGYGGQVEAAVAKSEAKRS